MNKATKAALVVMATLIVAGSTIAAPRMLIQDGSFDFGYAPQNSSVSHVFWLHSTGDDTLKILKVSPG